MRPDAMSASEGGHGGAPGAPSITPADHIDEPPYAPTEPMRGGVHVGSRMEELGVCLRESAAIIQILAEMPAPVPTAPEFSERIHAWWRHYRALMSSAEIPR
jgi:hypothetical protein